MKSLLLERYQYTGNQFLIKHCIAFQFIRNHIVNVLNKNNIRIQIIQILNQRTMPAGTEQKLTVIAEWLVFHISGNCISAWFLFGESDIIIYAITFGKSIDFFGNQ